MLNSVDDVVASASAVYAGKVLPRPFQFLTALEEIGSGGDIRTLAVTLGSTARRLEHLRTSTDPLRQIFKTSLEDAATSEKLKRARKGLGQMLLGTLSERIFEDVYKRTMGTEDLRLEDSRESRTDTDYRVYNGSNRAVFRLNIKFHGSPFRNAKDLVGLEPGDCFALATYKINQAMQKQEAERLPYIFLIVGVPGLRGETVGERLPEDLVHLCSFALSSNMAGKRDVEDAIVRHLIEHKQPADVSVWLDGIAAEIRAAEWRVLSAKRADTLLRTLLFERVYAVRVRAFTSNYRRAEVDMHFSISKDLTPLLDFLGMLKDHGLHGVTHRLAVGDV